VKLSVGQERDMAGDSEEWTIWLDQRLASLILLARQWVPARADAEDVVQEAFIRFWRSRHRVSDPAAYFYACVKHVALDWHRNRKRRSRREEATARPEATTLFTGPLEQGERRAAIEEALRDLPENQREVLVMRIWGGLTFPQIAAVLQISDHTAKSRYRYALAKLSEQLAEELIP
jgi:RNA polymerase sigma-70 factor (ECF subfamily)